MAADIYQHYQEMKGWDGEAFMAPTSSEVLFYNHYLGDVALAKAHVLEIGFGNGNFLGWAQALGAIPYGTEVQEAALDKARAHGVHVLPLDLAESAGQLDGRLSVIAAIDVMEHLTLEQNTALLNHAAAMLRAGGCLFLRFPNGQSPLSLPVQHGDMTHVSTLSIPIIGQMILGLPLTVEYAGPPYRTHAGGFGAKVLRRIQDIVRRCANRLVTLVYGELPLYANVVMLLRRGDRQMATRHPATQ